MIEVRVGRMLMVGKESKADYQEGSVNRTNYEDQNNRLYRKFCI